MLSAGGAAFWWYKSRGLKKLTSKTANKGKPKIESLQKVHPAPETMNDYPISRPRNLATVRQNAQPAKVIDVRKDALEV